MHDYGALLKSNISFIFCDDASAGVSTHHPSIEFFRKLPSKPLFQCVSCWHSNNESVRSQPGQPSIDTQPAIKTKGVHLLGAIANKALTIRLEDFKYRDFVTHPYLGCPNTGRDTKNITKSSKAGNDSRLMPLGEAAYLGDVGLIRNRMTDWQHDPKVSFREHIEDRLKSTKYYT